MFLIENSQVKIAETTSEDLEHHGSAAFQCSVTHHIILVAEIKRTKMKTFDSNRILDILIHFKINDKVNKISS